MPKVVTNCSSPNSRATLIVPNTWVPIRPGAQFEHTTYRRYQSMKPTVIGTTNLR